MPNYTIYVKQEDDEQWQKIANRTAWIHDHLKGERDLEEHMATLRAIDTENLKINTNGTVSPIDPAKPFRYAPRPNAPDITYEDVEESA